jgi:hypothetical protein
LLLQAWGIGNLGSAAATLTMHTAATLGRAAPALTDVQVDHVIAAIRSFFG